jgi:ribosomal protein L11 methyltransferase
MLAKRPRRHERTPEPRPNLVSYFGVRFDAPAAEAFAWSDALLAAGALSIDVSDPAAGTPDETPQYGEPGEPGEQLWPISRLSVLFASGADSLAALRIASDAIALPVPAYQTYVVAAQDWVRATQTQFGPIRIAEDFWIVPSWAQAPQADALNLRLDPGLAFGTGSHPTTGLCLEWMRTHIRGGESLLDYGCGSGILAIAGARLGAAHVVGTDVDPQAMRASKDNARANAVAATFDLPDALAPGSFDMVVANILANPLTLLAPALAQRVRPGGRIALSGILEPQADAVAAVYAHWFNIDIWKVRDGWVLLAGERVTGDGPRPGAAATARGIGRIRKHARNAGPVQEATAVSFRVKS